MDDLPAVVVGLAFEPGLFGDTGRHLTFQLQKDELLLPRSQELHRALILAARPRGAAPLGPAGLRFPG